jgi:hypothetical protein
LFLSPVSLFDKSSWLGEHAHNSEKGAGGASIPTPRRLWGDLVAKR